MATKRKIAPAKQTPKANAAAPVANTITVDEPLPKPIERPQSAWDRFLFYVQLRDSIWSIPLWFYLAYQVGVLLVWIFGAGVGEYDLSFIQALIMAGCVIVGLGGVTQYVIFFNWRTIQRYFIGKRKPAEGIIQNLSKDDFELITPWQRLKISLFIYLFYFVAGLVVFLKLS